MQNIIIFDDAEIRANLLPLTYTRPVGALRLGIDTLAEKWQSLLPGNYGWDAGAEYLHPLFPGIENTDGKDTLYIAGHVVATPALAAAVGALLPGEALYGPDNCGLIARRGCEEKTHIDFDSETLRMLRQLPDIFLLNGDQLADDFKRLCSGRRSAPLSASCTVIGDPSLIFIEEGATVEGAIINTKGGPVYIGPEAEIMEGSCLRGPIALCRHATINMGTKVYGSTTIGPFCKVGGELNNVVMQGYSNKAHDGFLGNAVIGEWCNLGAGCVASNLKNDYTSIKLWNYPSHRFLPTGLQFCGLIMGDHSKAGINTMFNTATVVGVGVNIHGSGFPRNFVASFQEGGAAGFSEVSMTKFFDIARRVMARRGRELSEADERMFYAIREAAESYK